MTRDFDPADEAIQIRSRLEELAARPAWGPRKIHLRIGTPNLRAIARERWTEIERASGPQLAELVDLLWTGVTYDEMFVAVEIMRRRPELVNQDRIERWRGWLDQWGITDELASVVRKWVADDPTTRFDYIAALASSDDVWTRRLGIASTVLMSREGKELDRTLELIDRVADDRRRMIVNAVSWALREMTKSDPARVERYVDANHDHLAARVRLEVWNKLRTGRKDGGENHPLKARIDRARARSEERRSRPKRKDRPKS